MRGQTVEVGVAGGEAFTMFDDAIPEVNCIVIILKSRREGNASSIDRAKMALHILTNGGGEQVQHLI